MWITAQSTFINFAKAKKKYLESSCGTQFRQSIGPRTKIAAMSRVAYVILSCSYEKDTVKMF